MASNTWAYYTCISIAGAGATTEWSIEQGGSVI